MALGWIFRSTLNQLQSRARGEAGRVSPAIVHDFLVYIIQQQILTHNTHLSPGQVLWLRTGRSAKRG